MSGLSPRAAMILSVLIPDAHSRLLGADDRERLAAQFGMKPERVDDMAASVVLAIVRAGSILDDCQPAGAKRCPHCGGLCE